MEIDDMVETKNFIFKITKEQADEILNMEKDKHPIRIGLLCEYGAIVPESAEIIVEYDIDGNCYVASKDMLVRGDKLACYLKHDVDEAVCSRGLARI